MASLVLTLLAVLSLSASAQQHERFQKVLIDFGSVGELHDLHSFDEHGVGNASDGIEAILSESDVRSLRQSGVGVTILVPDLQSFYADRAAASMKKTTAARILSADEAPENFSLGSVAGYYTLEELTDQLRRMHERFPELASEPISIGKSVEGRDILAVRISARPSSGELPEILFTGMHHAREPISMMSLVYTMWSLLEESSDDAEVASLLGSRALWFVPLVNPDGYAYNVEYFPQGGGLWRKNRGGVGNEGVDLNRNYGASPTWLTPPEGGNDDPLSGSFRGPVPFSEPETRAIRDFILSHDFRIALNFHSYSNVLIYKHSGPIPDLADTMWYFTSARELALENGLGHGRGVEAIGYDAEGTLDEWMFDLGNGGRRAFAWTPEVGSAEDGFWPTPDRIPALCRRMLPMSVRAAWMAGPLPAVVGWNSGTVGGRPTIELSVGNIGTGPMDAGAELRLDGFDGTSVAVPSLRPGDSYRASIPVPDELAARPASRASLDVVIRYGAHEWKRDIEALIHTIDTLFEDRFESSLGRWSNNLWGVETSGSRGRVLSDSPYEDYFESDIPNVLELAAPVSLAGYDAAELRFDARAMIRGVHHSLVLEARRGGERTWHQLDGEYLQSSATDVSDLRTQFRGANREWRQYSVPLDAFAGEDVMIRFVMNSPYSGSSGPLFDGILLDDLRIVGARSIPTTVDDPGTSDTVAFPVIAWPNPCRDRLHVRGMRTGTTALQLFDMLGREMQAPVVATSDGGTIDVEGVPEGSYVLSMRNAGETVRLKIVKR